MGKELSNALHAVATAESKATVAEARLSDMEKKIKSSEIKVSATDGHFQDSTDEVSIFTCFFKLCACEWLSAVAHLHSSKEEILQLKQLSKDHMLHLEKCLQGMWHISKVPLPNYRADHDERQTGRNDE